MAPAGAAAPPSSTGARSRRGRIADVALVAALSGGALWLIFSAGGFFDATTAQATAATGLALAAWLALAPRPLAGASRTLALAVGALALLAGWMLLSQTWSHAPGRALYEFDRTLLYVFATALAGLAAGIPAVRRAMPRAVATTAVVACAGGLITRLLPELWPIADTIEFTRLSYPLTYWNAQGTLAALGVLACVHLACSQSEPRPLRAAAAAAMPILAVALLLTFSRGAIFLLPIAIVAYLLLARPRGAAAAAIAIVPTTVVALVVTYHTDTVVDAPGPTAALVEQGRVVAAAIGACALVSAALLVLLRPLDERAARWRTWKLGRRGAVRLAVAAATLVAIAGVAVDAPQRVADEVDRLSQASFTNEQAGARQRLTSLADNGRVDQWRVSLDGFESEPLHGSGAGTFALLWTRDRSIDQDVNDGHSLYLEVLAELGVVGGLLIALAVGSLLVGCAARTRGEDRATGALGFSVLLLWALHAGIDWDWEMPGLTLPALALAAAVVARPSARAFAAAAPRRRRFPPIVARVAAVAAVLVLLVVPLSISGFESRSDAARAALQAGRCDDALADARSAIRVIASRAEPYQVTAICELRAGRPRAAAVAVEAALRRDPDNWRLHYALAVVRAADGRDPYPALRAARARNPRSSLVRDAFSHFDVPSAAGWRERARTSSIPF